MTNQVIPAEAVEAAAKSIFGVDDATWDLQTQRVREAYLEDAKNALEAAAPYMLADILEDAANTAETDELTTAAEIIYDLRRHAKDLRPMLNNEGEK